MKRVTVNGDPYEARDLAESDVRPGTLVSGIDFRRAERVVCIDGTDAILRNLRRPALFEAVPVSDMPRYYQVIEPAPRVARGGGRRAG